MAQAKQSVLDLPWQRLNAQLRAALGQDSERLDEHLLDGFTVQISAALSTLRVGSRTIASAESGC